MSTLSAKRIIREINRLKKSPRPIMDVGDYVLEHWAIIERALILAAREEQRLRVYEKRMREVYRELKGKYK